MAGYTDYLNLYFKNPRTDGSDTFNVQTMMNDNWNKIDAFASMAGLPPAGNGYVYIVCHNGNGDPVSGCVCQIGRDIAITSEMGIAKFTVPSGTYSASILSPIDYGAEEQTVSVSVENSGVEKVQITITDSVGSIHEIGFTRSLICAFSDRVVSADAFVVGPGGSGGAAVAIWDGNTQRSVSASAGAGGKTKTVNDIDISSVFDVLIGAGGDPATINKTITSNNGVYTATGNRGGTTILKSSGVVIASAESGWGGNRPGDLGKSSYAYGVSGGSGSGAAYALPLPEIPVVADSGYDGGDGQSIPLSIPTIPTITEISGGQGQGSTTVPFNGESTAPARSAAGASVAANYRNLLVGATGEGGGIGIAKSFENSDINISAGSGSLPGAGGGACAALHYFNSGSQYTLVLNSGAGADGEVRFRWEVKS